MSKKLYEKTIHIIPVAQGRPRICRIGNGVRAVDPDKSRIYKSELKTLAEYETEPINGPIDIELDFVIPVPASWSKKKTGDALVGKVLPKGKPDLDNYVKAVCDAFNGLVWADDSLVVSLKARKFYGENPQVRITVYDHDLMVW